MSTWTPAQRRYSASSKGREARKRYQQSEKGKASRIAYLARRRAKLAEAKQVEIITVDEPEAKPEHPKMEAKK